MPFIIELDNDDKDYIYVETFPIMRYLIINGEIIKTLSILTLQKTGNLLTVRLFITFEFEKNKLFYSYTRAVTTELSRRRRRRRRRNRVVAYEEREGAVVFGRFTEQDAMSAFEARERREIEIALYQRYRRERDCRRRLMELALRERERSGEEGETGETEEHE